MVGIGAHTCQMGATVLLLEQKVFYAIKIAECASVIANGHTAMQNTGVGHLAGPHIKTGYLRFNNWTDMLHRNGIGGEWIEGVTANRNINPSKPKDVIGEYASADVAQTGGAIAVVHFAALVWAALSPEVRADPQLSGLKAMRNLKAFVATVSRKTAVADLCDWVSKQATAIRAVNTLRHKAGSRLVGERFDCARFSEMRGRRYYLADIGEAANAIACMSPEAGQSLLTSANRTRSKREDLKQRFPEHCRLVPAEIGTTDPSMHEIVADATKPRLEERDPVSLDFNHPTLDHIAAEVAMKPEFTALIASEGRGTSHPFGRTHAQRPTRVFGRIFRGASIDARPAVDGPGGRCALIRGGASGITVGGTLLNKAVR